MASRVYRTNPKVWHYRELLKNLIVKDLKLKYRGSFLGFLWSLFNPLIMIIVYSIAFKYILRIRLENYTLFLITGILPWTFFNTAVMASTEAVLSNANLVKKIHFPREILPLGAVLFNFVQFLLALVVFFPASIFLHAKLTPALAAYPAVVLLQLAFTVGVALLLSAITVFYQDVKHLTEVGLMTLFWVTPILYHFSMIPERVRWIFKLNPMTAYIRAYQDIVYWGRWPAGETWGLAIVWVIVMLALGGWVFNHYNPGFAEEL